MTTTFPTTGLHESLVTQDLRAQLATLPADTLADLSKLDPGDAHDTLARHVYHLLRRSLRGKPEEQADFCNKLLTLAAEHLKAADEDEAIELPPLQLREVRPADGPGTPPRLVRPTTPLSTSALLTNATGEPSVGSELKREMASADSVDLICAFVKVYGVRLIEDELDQLRRRGVRLRVLTTTYMAATERVALERLAGLGAEIKIAYEAKTTRLHAKAWLFHRSSGFSTAYVGSSNLSKSALVDGLEWNVRLSQVEAPHLIEKFRATFDTYWESPTFEAYDPDRDRDRFDRALVDQRGRDIHVDLTPFDIRAWPHQEKMLEAIHAERERHNRWRSLVVAATGTGKTVVAALDYRRLNAAHHDKHSGDLKLLFVAHRKEILEQTRITFRHVLRDASFGELYVAGARPERWDHVFASVQSLAAPSAEIDPKHFDVVIIDEFHHAAAPTYRRLLERLRPTVLLGLTATPERTDGQSILEWFDDHIAVELRLWDALDEQLLCPFHYFGVADGTDLSRLEWRRGGYLPSELENVYTANDLRVAKVLEALRSKLPSLSSMRALGFCVSVAHANFMASRFITVARRRVRLRADGRFPARDALSLRRGPDASDVHRVTRSTRTTRRVWPFRASLPHSRGRREGASMGHRGVGQTPSDRRQLPAPQLVGPDALRCRGDLMPRPDANGSPRATRNILDAGHHCSIRLIDAYASIAVSRFPLPSWLGNVAGHAKRRGESERLSAESSHSVAPLDGMRRHMLALRFHATCGTTEHGDCPRPLESGF